MREYRGFNNIYMKNILSVKKLVITGVIILLVGIAFQQSYLLKSKSEICKEWAMKGMNFTFEGREKFSSLPENKQRKLSFYIINKKESECRKKSNEKLPWKDNRTTKRELVKWIEKVSLNDLLREKKDQFEK